MSWKCLTFEDRRKIERLYDEGRRPEDIAEEVGRHVATVYRELRRGGFEYLDGLRYSAEKGEAAYRRGLRNRGRKKQTDAGAGAGT